MTAFFAFVPATACVICAGVLGSQKSAAWGWFLFAALLMAGLAAGK
jgi:hypothetical protein